jgi:hypothetical protein
MLLLLAALPGCGPQAETDLEIVEITPAEPGPWPYGDTASFRVEVRNHGPQRVTITAAVVGGVEMGLLRKGPELEVRRNRTETLKLEIPLAAPYVKRCRLETEVFLARPGEPGNLFSDLWTDPVPDNHSRGITYPVDRPVAADIQAPGALREIVEPSSEAVFRRHYEGPLSVQPEGSEWSITRLQVQTQDGRAMPVELLGADLLGGTLTTGSVIWDGGERTRDSVLQALIGATVQDCDGVESMLRDPAVAVVLEPR